MHHPTIVQSPIVNDFMKVEVDVYTELQLVLKLLFQFYVRELHNKLVRATINGELIEERNEDDNIIISDFTLSSLLPPLFLKMSSI